MTSWLDPEWTEEGIAHIFGHPPKPWKEEPAPASKPVYGCEIPDEKDELALRADPICGVMRLPGKLGPETLGDEE